MRHGLRVFVVSDREKASPKTCQVSIEETNANEPLMRYRYGLNVVKTEGLKHSQDKHRRQLVSGGAATGIETA